MDEKVHVYMHGETGGRHACTETDSGWLGGEVWAGPVRRVTLGRTFIDDHMESRGLPAGIIVDENKRTYTLLMTPDDIREVYSDARHYADSMGEWSEGRSVIQAARRVVAAMKAQLGL